ncbi:MAG TPA: HAD-IA family hydrolase [Streptosporangiaceae bacterium]|nr:HAD-IA family hydrolase [Streptosporangiaceae bacterium]
MSALLLGSISTVADTSELQRQAFNQAFAAHGLDWRWDRDDYQAMLSRNGGQDRISEYAKSRGQAVDAQAIHESKSQIFRDSLATAGLAPRPGVADTIKAARDHGWKVGLVTTTARANVSTLLDRLRPQLSDQDFDIIVDRSSVEAPKPYPDAYVFALQALAEAPVNCVAVEDNVGGVQAAADAGVPCVAFPNENTGGLDFAGAADRVSRLDFAAVASLVHGGQEVR